MSKVTNENYCEHMKAGEIYKFTTPTGDGTDDGTASSTGNVECFLLIEENPIDIPINGWGGTRWKCLVFRPNDPEFVPYHRNILFSPEDISIWFVERTYGIENK